MRKGFNGIAQGRRTTATVNVGGFSRNGKRRVEVNAADHDFYLKAQGAPVALLLPSRNERALRAVTSQVSRDGGGTFCND